MRADPHAAYAACRFSTHPAAGYAMPPPTAEAARQFREAVRATDPTGHLRAQGEFAQSFRLEGGRVVPNGPIAYESGSAIDCPSTPPGSFTTIHSHPYAAPPLRNDFPSPDDYIAARQAMKQTGEPHQLLYHPASDRFFAYTGSVPPIFFEARFPVPSHTVPGSQAPPPGAFTASPP
jgi:hypothetical protein